MSGNHNMSKGVPESPGGRSSRAESEKQEQVQVDALTDEMVSSLKLGDNPVPELDFHSGTFVDAVISYIADHNTFYCQPVCHGDALKRQQLLMNAYFKPELVSDQGVLGELPLTPPTPLPQQKVAIGTAPYAGKGPIVHCAAPHEDGIYYRALLVSRVSPGQVQVFFIDYGNEAIVPISQLMELPSGFKSLRPACFRSEMPGAPLTPIDLGWLRFIVEGETVVLKIQSVKEDGCVVAEFYRVENEDEYDYPEVVLASYEHYKAVEDPTVDLQPPSAFAQ